MSPLSFSHCFHHAHVVARGHLPMKKPTLRSAMKCSAQRKSAAPGFSARTPCQKKYLEILHAKKPDIVVAAGVAGCGKTLLATYVGIQKLMANEVRKIVITRPAVSVDEQHGFLPGSLERKMEPWVRPIYDVLETQYPKSKVDNMIKEHIIEICPLAFMRGRTFDDTWIICDEAQNMTPNQMLMVMTRIGNNSKLVITGDLQQHDRGYTINGLSDLLDRMRCNSGGILCNESEEDAPYCNLVDSENNTVDIRSWIQLIEFDKSNVQRNPIIPHILDLYE